MGAWHPFLIPLLGASVCDTRIALLGACWSAARPYTFDCFDCVVVIGAYTFGCVAVIGAYTFGCVVVIGAYTFDCVVVIGAYTFDCVVAIGAYTFDCVAVIGAYTFDCVVVIGAYTFGCVVVIGACLCLGERDTRPKYVSHTPPREHGLSHGGITANTAADSCMHQVARRCLGHLPCAYACS